MFRSLAGEVASRPAGQSGAGQGRMRNRAAAEGSALADVILIEPSE
jgi:hypothetical protein